MTEIHLQTVTLPCHGQEARDIAQEVLKPFGSNAAFAIGCPIVTSEDDESDGEPYLDRSTLIYRQTPGDIVIEEIDHMSIDDKMRYGGPSFVLLSDENATAAALIAFKQMTQDDHIDRGVLIVFRDGLLVMNDSIWLDIVDCIAEGTDVKDSANNAVRIIIPEGLSAHKQLPFIQEACAFIEAVLKIEAAGRPNDDRLTIFQDVTVRAA